MVAAPALIDLGVLLALIFLIGLSFGYRYSLGALLQTLVLALNAIRLPRAFGFGGQRIFGPIADALDSIDHTIRNAIGRGISDMQAAWNEAASFTAYAVGWVGREIASLSHDTAQAVEGLASRQVPRWITNRLAAALAAIATLKATALALEHAGVKRIERTVHPITAKLTIVYKSVAAPAIAAVPKALPRLGQVEREADAAEKWIRANAKRLTVGAAIGVTAAALSRLGLGWTRCSNVTRVGKRLCGMDKSLIDDLLAGTLLIGSSISVVELAKECQTFTGEVEAGLRLFVRELE